MTQSRKAPKAKPKPKLIDKEQSERFIDAVHAVNADQHRDRFEAKAAEIIRTKVKRLPE